MVSVGRMMVFVLVGLWGVHAGAPPYQMGAHSTVVEKGIESSLPVSGIARSTLEEAIEDGLTRCGYLNLEIDLARQEIDRYVTDIRLSSAAGATVVFIRETHPRAEKCVIVLYPTRYRETFTVEDLNSGREVEIEVDSAFVRAHELGHSRADAVVAGRSQERFAEDIRQDEARATNEYHRRVGGDPPSSYNTGFTQGGDLERRHRAQGLAAGEAVADRPQD